MKKFYALTLSAIFLLSALSAYSQAGEAIEHDYFSKVKDKPLIALPQMPTKANYNKVCEINFEIHDSLANSYSYFTSSGEPFVYTPDLNILTIITRGYHDPAVDPSYNGDDTKDNLFIQYSEDWGITWTDEELAYEGGTGTAARYPSVYPFLYDGEIAFTYTASVPSTSPDGGWEGLIYGVLEGGFGFGQIFEKEEVTVGNGSYTLSTGNMVYGEEVDQAIVLTALLDLYEQTGFDHDNASHIGVFRTEDLQDPEITVPDNLNAASFVTPDTDSSSSSFPVGKTVIGDKIYLGLLGDYLDDNTDFFLPSVTVSTDGGMTWGEKDECPPSVILDYVNSQGFSLTLEQLRDKFLFFRNFDFTALSNGNCHFVAWLREIDLPDAKAVWDFQHHIVEIYRVDGSWGIRKVKEFNGLFAQYFDADGNRITDDGGRYGNQLYIELQLAKSEDEEHILAKWVEIWDYEEVTDSTYRPLAYDMFMSGRAVGDDNWSTPMNMTNDPEIDKVTWIPDIVPSGLINIPVIELQTILNETDNPAIALFQNERAQYVLLGFTDFTLDVNDEAPVSESPEITSITPNPLNRAGHVNFNLPVGGNVEISIYDIMGRKVSNVLNSHLGSGINSVDFEVSSLPAGAYYCSIKFRGSVTSQMFVVSK